MEPIEKLDFQTIYATYQPKILRYVLRLVGEREAEDLTQEIFVKIHQGLDRFKGESQLSTWIYRIATNASIDKIRSFSTRQNAELNLLDEIDETEEIISWTGDETPSLEHMLMRREMYECFTSYVENLPVNYQTVILLSELEGMTNNEIADILGISLEVVKIRLHRGRERLISELKTHCKAEDWL